MSRVVHFEIPADDTSRAAAFYTDVFNWKIEKAEMAGPMEYLLATTGEDSTLGINGAIMPRGGGVDVTVNTVEIPDIDATLARVTAQGGEILTEKMDIPGIGTFAYCKDTEGNAFGVLQPPAEMSS